MRGKNSSKVNKGSGSSRRKSFRRLDRSCGSLTLPMRSSPSCSCCRSRAIRRSSTVFEVPGMRKSPSVHRWHERASTRSWTMRGTPELGSVVRVERGTPNTLPLGSLEYIVCVILGLGVMGGGGGRGDTSVGGGGGCLLGLFDRGCAREGGCKPSRRWGGLLWLPSLRIRIR